MLLRMALLVVAGLVPVSAWGQPSPCTVVVTPPAGATVPASVPALHYVVVTRGGGMQAGAPQGVQLVSRAGVALPVTVRDDPHYGYRIVLMEKPVPGAHRLRVPDPCAGGMREVDITFGPELALPTAPPTVAVNRRVGDLRYGCRGDAYTLRAHPYLDVNIGVSSQWQPFLPVLMVESLVDGVVWGRSPYGDIDAIDRPTTGGQLQRAPDKLYPACGQRGDGPGQDECPIASLGIMPGKHQIEVKLRVLGSASEPAPVAVDFDIDCAGIGAAPPGGTPSPTTGGGSSSAGGCAVAGGRGSPLLLLLLLVLGCARRRR